MNCFLHPEKAAADSLTVPCAPGGKIHLCAECAAADRPTTLQVVWAKYQATHGKSIEVFKTPANPRN